MYPKTSILMLPRAQHCSKLQRVRDGSSSHHIIEAIFKEFARALRQALEYDARHPRSIPRFNSIEVRPQLNHVKMRHGNLTLIKPFTCGQKCSIGEKSSE